MLALGVGYRHQLMVLVVKLKICGYFTLQRYRIFRGRSHLSYKVQRSTSIDCCMTYLTEHGTVSTGSWEDTTSLTDCSAMLFRALNGLIERSVSLYCITTMHTRLVSIFHMNTVDFIDVCYKNVLSCDSLTSVGNELMIMLMIL